MTPKSVFLGLLQRIRDFEANYGKKPDAITISPEEMEHLKSYLATELRSDYKIMADVRILKGVTLVIAEVKE